MDKEIEAAIKVLLRKIHGDIQPDAALKFTQAVLNLTHGAATIVNTKAVWISNQGDTDIE